MSVSEAGAAHHVSASARAGAWLTVDCTALADNYRRLARLAEASECAAVVKADGYGLGAEPVAAALAKAGARTFFVAHEEEGRAIRVVLPSARIFVLHGFMPGCAEAFQATGLLPVLNDMHQIQEWSATGRRLGRKLPCAIQVDSGMSRFGVSEADLRAEAVFEAVVPVLVMSHLACADSPDHSANEAQRSRFLAMAERFPGVPRSLAASSGIFLGPAFHFELVRPGAALYGVAPNAVTPALRPVVRLDARIVQVRTLQAGDGVGYGLTWRAERPARVATLGIGYADGFFRAQAGRASVWYRDKRLPLLGRVSMDSVSVDITEVSDPLAPGDVLEVIGPHQSLDALAQTGGTIGYEILTALGHRFHRHYTGS